MNLFALQLSVILPFRSSFPELKTSGRIPEDKWDTEFYFYYVDSVAFDFGTINTNLCTLLDIKTLLPFNGTSEDVIYWVKGSNQAKIIEIAMNKTNYFIMHLKSIMNDPVLRTVGDVDIIYLNAKVDDTTVVSRGTSTFASQFNVDLNNIKLDDVASKINISKNLPKEWKIFVRASDLVNHGYHLEGFIIAFALLDDLVQKFIIDKLPHIQKNEAKDLLRRIEKQRLTTYLGVLSKIALGHSILEDKQIAEKIKWLNTTRNRVMHEGAEVSVAESQKGLTIVFEILHRLNLFGAKYSLPSKLKFWTPIQ